jgi:hypothetical protein
VPDGRGARPDAVMFVADWGVKDLYDITNVHFDNVNVDVTGTAVVNARAAGSATFSHVVARNVGTIDSGQYASGINDCGTFHFTGTPEFSVQVDGSDQGWTGPWFRDDHPTQVPPPPPTG